MTYSRLTKAELLAELESMKAAQQSGIISWPDQVQNIRARWDIHQAEWSKAVADTCEVGRQTRRLYENTRTQFNF